MSDSTYRDGVFKIGAYHDGLRRIPHMAEETLKRAQWSLKIQYISSNAFHRAGIKQQTADSLSRLDTTGGDWKELNEEVPLLLIEAGMTLESKYMVCEICEKKGRDPYNSGSHDDKYWLPLQPNRLFRNDPPTITTKAYPTKS